MNVVLHCKMTATTGYTDKSNCEIGKIAGKHSPKVVKICATENIIVPPPSNMKSFGAAQGHLLGLDGWMSWANSLIWMPHSFYQQFFFCCMHTSDTDVLDEYIVSPTPSHSYTHSPF